MNFADFSRRFAARRGNLMWFLGAGVSASAGIATARQIIDDLKQQLYVTHKRVNRTVVSDLTNPSIRAMLQNFIDDLGSLPKAGEADEYSKIFEATYPNERDRRTYLEGKIRGAKPSYGHVALAILLKAQHSNIVWTTNFDPLLADACSTVFGTTGKLRTIEIGTSQRIGEALTGAKWPLEVKLHGDFRWDKLKNTTDELISQDKDMRAGLIESCKTYGLIVGGYAGHDRSIMEALNNAVDQPNSFPHGLFWLHRGEKPPHDEVTNLLQKASVKGVDAALVRIENFDEALFDLVHATSGLDLAPLSSFGLERKIREPAPPPYGRPREPGVRLNGIMITNMPTVARIVHCSNIGSGKEVNDLIIQNGGNLVAARTKEGLIGFGADDEFHRVFAEKSLSEFSIKPIETKRMVYDSRERGLVRRALSLAIARNAGPTLLPQRNTDLFYPTAPSDSRWGDLRSLAGQLHGTVVGHPELEWKEGLGLRIEWANSALWMLIDPRIILLGATNDNLSAGSSFVRERSARRYNSQTYKLLGDCNPKQRTRNKSV